MKSYNARRLAFTFVIALVLLGAGTAAAQTTAFTYQGKLTDGGNPADGSYDLTFKLFDSAAVGGGTQQGATLSLTGVAVSGGVFTAQLDFGACAGCFNGAARFLEIAVRPSGGGSFTTLSPRQPITSTPYAVRSVSAANADGLSVTCVSCVTSAQIQSVQGSQVTGGIAGGQITGTIPLASVPAGSASYIQNTTTQQAASNFNVSGNGTVGGTLTASFVNATSAFSINGAVILRAPTDNLSVGLGAGIPGGHSNTSVGTSAGVTTSSGASENTFVGFAAGNFIRNINGSDNTLLGARTMVGDSVSNATAVGYGAGVTQSNSLVLGNGANVGIGTPAPQFKLHVIDTSNKGLRVETDSPGGTVASFGGAGEFQIDSNGIAGGRLNVKENGTVILGDCPGCFPNTDRLVVGGTVSIFSLGSAGSSSLCLNGSHQISACSSSVRYKTNIVGWRGGLSLISRLRPVTFDWKESKAHDLGLVAEEVAEAEPLLVTRNQKGEIEGVKYDRLNVVLINAIKEQQEQIKSQEAQIKSQADALAALQTRLASLERAVRQPRHRRRAENVGKGR